MITGDAIGGGVLLWINMKKGVSTEGCHAVVEFMHRRRKQAQQHDRNALELALRFLDRENEMVRREYWGECFSTSLP